MRSALAWVLRPEAKWLRIPLGLVLILGGFLGFLPILGFWMIPLGALLLAEDFPWVRKPTVRAIDAVESWWKRRHLTKGKREIHDSLQP
jgi:purine-cytosine permease-like protein